MEIGPLFVIGPRWRDRVLPFPEERGMGWGLELAWLDLFREGCELGIVDAVRVRHEGSRGEEYDDVDEIDRVHARLESLGYRGWSDVQVTLGTWRPWQRAPSWGRGAGRMRLVLTLLARDEADIVDAQIAFHLHAGVDFVIATDNGSRDETLEILERYERAGRLLLLHEAGQDMRQDEWVTRMARLAATEHGADWVINADADEFWWPRSGSLKDVLASIPERYGVVRGCWRHFVPRPWTDAFFAERMTVRLCAPAHPGDKETIFHAHQKVAHRADPDVSIEPGNHDATSPRLAPLRGWHPLEVLHFSLRSPAQLERKAVRDWVGWTQNPHGPTLHQELAYAALEAGRLDEYYESFVVGDDELARGLAEGSLAIDTRLRDALRALATTGDDGRFALPDGASERLSFPQPAAQDDAIYASEASVLADIDGVVRAERRVDALEERLVSLERGPLGRLRSLVR